MCLFSCQAFRARAPLFNTNSIGGPSSFPCVVPNIFVDQGGRKEAEISNLGKERRRGWLAKIE